MALRRALLLLLGCAACSKPEPPHRTEPWLAHPSASASAVAAVGGPRAYRFTRGSSVRFSVAGRKAKLTGSVPLTRGELRFDPRDLQGARASIDVDLTQLQIDGEAPEGVELSGATPTATALQWLELGPRVPAERRAQFATARFELSALEGLSSSVLELGRARPATPVRATAVGTLLIHGFRAPIRAELRLSPAGGSAERVAIQSASALVVPLAPHDITARDASGVVDALGAARAADWVGKQAQVVFELVAEPETPATQ